MMTLPQEFVKRMESQLQDEADSFFASLEQPSPTSIRLHHLKGRSSFDYLEKVPWCSAGYYLASRPFFHLDPHWHGGAYYVQEASSMILDHVLTQLALEKKSRTWLDLCAAPGGKTGILARHLGTSDILVANEVVGQRRSILKENLTKAGYINTFITGESTSAFSEPFADIILIDAPCAGEGMMRKEPEAIRQWTPSLVDSCSMTQRQIVKDAALALKKDGCLIYSTCSYSMDENIQNIKHFITEHNLEPVPISFPEEWGISRIAEGEAIGYQLYPHKVKGEGLFIAVMKRNSEQEKHSFRKIRKPNQSFEPVSSLVAEKLNTATTYLLRKNSPSFELITADAIEKANEVVMHLPRASLVVDAGEMKGKDFIPSHVMAMAEIQSSEYEIIDLDLTHSLDYLERSTNTLPAVTNPGWYMVRYDTTILGWVKNTQQGWKNHYPMNWRLRDRKGRS